MTRQRRFIERVLVGAAARAAVVVVVMLPVDRASAQESALEKDDTDAHAVALHRELKNAAATKTAREVAQFDLAVSLYRRQLYRAAFGIFSDIADHPDHVRFSATLLWLTKLAIHLPEPADVGERVGRYDGAEVAKLDNPSQRETFWHVNYMLGRVKYQSGQYEEAVRRFSGVPPTSRYYAKSQLIAGISKVMLRRPMEAIQAFEGVVDVIESQRDVDTVEDPGRMRDAALLSIARTYYAMSMRIDANGTPEIDRAHMAAAITHWNTVNEAGENWLDALGEQAWGYFMTREHARALGNLHMVQLDVFPMTYSPEADVLRSVIYIANCQYDDAATLAARFHEKYQPIESELSRVFRSYRDQGDEAFYRLLSDVRDGKANLSPRVYRALVNALADRELLRHRQYVQVLDDERRRFDRLGAALRTSALGDDIKEALQLAQDLAVQRAGQLARERIERALDELRGFIRHNTTLLDAALTRNGGARGPWTVRADDARGVARAEDDQILWPFTGELWRDEGRHQQSLPSRCK